MKLEYGACLFHGLTPGAIADSGQSGTSFRNLDYPGALRRILEHLGAGVADFFGAAERVSREQGAAFESATEKEG